MADSDFDPRFDPAFQPGYDPSKHAPETPARAEAPTRQTKKPDHQAQQQDEYAPPPPSGSARHPVSAPGSPSVSQPSRVEQPAPVTTGVTVAPRRNPLIITLWILSALLVASGVYGLRLISDRVTSLGDSGGFGGADYYLLQSYTVLAPLLIVLGLATAVGTIFVLAVRRFPPR